MSGLKHIAIIWQRFLPYHAARIRHLGNRLGQLNQRLTAIEIASQDKSYIFPEFKFSSKGFEHICCFDRASYHQFKSNEIYKKVFSLLVELKPDIIFAPAAAFPEGMAAFTYRLTSGARAVMMDDAWEYTDRRGILKKQIKRLIHKNVDGVFIPAPSHLPYYKKMGFSEERVVFGVDVIDNDYYAEESERALGNEGNLRALKKLPENYFLFVGRFLRRKGIENLITAFADYRSKMAQDPWDLVLVGGGESLENIRSLARDIPGILFVGPEFGDSLCQYYALARALIVPSIIDPWGLVVNEGMASGLPVIVSRRCGSAKTLVHEGENGWTFESEDVDTLCGLLLRISSLPPDKLTEMGKKSKSVISDWSLDRFVDGVMAATQIPRRPPGGILSNILTRVWKGHVKVN